MTDGRNKRPIRLVTYYRLDVLKFMTADRVGVLYADVRFSMGDPNVVTGHPESYFLLASLLLYFSFSVQQYKQCLYKSGRPGGV